jgi:tetratricopeptide (TPR) repeat protein
VQEEKEGNEKRVTLEIVPLGPSSLLKRATALVRRGLDDLSKSVVKKGRVLLINDQDALLALMEQILVADGYEVRWTCRQLDAIDLAKSFEPQVAMLGLTMPVTLGSELSALLSGPKIVLWGEPDDSEDLEIRRNYYEFDFLPIPFSAERLLKDMRSWVAEAWTAEGVILDAKGHHQEALHCHEKALTVEPQCVHAWLNQGYSLDELGKWSEAIESYDNVIAINPSGWRVHVRKGDLLDRAGRFEDAILCFDSALAISTDLVSGWMGRGTALHHLSRYREALVCYDKVLELDRPTWTAFGKAHIYSDAWNSKGTSFYRMGSYQESIECYEKAIEIDPGFAFPWYNKGNSLLEMNSFDEAIRCYDRAIENDSTHAGSWNNKGSCFRKLGRLEEALMCHEKAVTCNPLEVRAWYNKALVQDDLGRVEDAINSYEKYVAVAPTDAAENVDHAQQRLLVLKAKGKTQGLAQPFNKADEIRRLHPDDLDAETKFYNSAFFSNYLAYATDPKIGEAREFSLLLLDIDGLKAAALTAAGIHDRSRLLREVADKIWEICSYEHWGFRIAENEFAIVMWSIDREGALRAGNHVKSQIQREIWPEGVHLFVKVAVATYPADGASESSLMHSAKSSFL